VSNKKPSPKTVTMAFRIKKQTQTCSLTSEIEIKLAPGGHKTKPNHQQLCFDGDFGEVGGVGSERRNQRIWQRLFISSISFSGA